MKYTIYGYQQDSCLKLGLDIIDIAILRWLQDFYPKMSKKIIDGKEYAWVNYQSFIDDMPILGLKTKDALYRRLKRLEEKKLIEKTCERNKDGVFSYLRFHPENVTNLLEYHTDENPEPIRIEIRNHTDENPEQNNPSTINNPSTKEIHVQFKEQFEEFWKIYPKKQGKKKAEEKFNIALRDGTTLLQIIAGVTRYLKYIETNKIEEKYIKMPQTWLHQGCWDDVYNVSKKVSGIF